MTRPEASAEFYRRLQRLQIVAVMAGRRAWAGMSPDFDSSWLRLARDLVTVTAAAQLAAARAATEYVPAVLAETGQPDEPEAQVRPVGFAGIASDGRPLQGLLYGAVAHSRAAVRAGYAPAAALQVGGKRLDALVRSTVTDAARQATAAEITTRQGMGWVRMVNLPCCPKCAILAGRWYRWSDGFSRHPPTCDCTHIPATENMAGDLRTDPAELFAAGQVNGLTQREQERLAAGEDPVKVVNESRDMWRSRRTEQRRADREAAKAAARGESAPPADPVARDKQARQGLEDLFASTRSRVDALRAARTEGYLL